MIPLNASKPMSVETSTTTSTTNMTCWLSHVEDIINARASPILKGIVIFFLSIFTFVVLLTPIIQIIFMERFDGLYMDFLYGRKYSKNITVGKGYTNNGTDFDDYYVEHDYPNMNPLS